MLRIILWRIYFETLCLLKALGFKDCPKENLRPTKEYLGKILNGYSHYLENDSPFVHRLKSIEVLDEMIPERPPYFLFQNYGRPGSLSHYFLKWYDTKSVGLFTFFIFRDSLFQRWLQ